MSAILDVRDEILAISLLPEANVNTPYLTTADYIKFLTEPVPLVEPQWDKTADNKNVGDGTRHARKTVRTYVKQRNYAFNHDLNSHISNIIAVRGMGGAVTDAAIASNAGCFEHTVPMGAGTGVKFSSFVHKLGTLGFLNWSLGVNSWTIKQAGEQNPMFSSDLICPGGFHTLFAYADDVLKFPVTLDAAAATAAPEYFTYLGAKTKLTFSDGVSNWSFTAGDQRLLNVEVTVAQNIVVKRLPGDLQLHASNTKYGYVPNRVYHQTHSVAINFDLFLTDQDADFKFALDKGTVNNLKVTFEGEKMITAGTAFYTFEVIVPKSELGDLGAGMDDTFGTISRSINSPADIFADPVTGGLCTLRIRDKVAALR